MNIDAISAIRQATQQLTPQSLNAQKAQVDAFRDLVRNGASNEGSTPSPSGLDNPATLSERFFSRVSDMQKNHKAVMIPVQERMVELSGRGINVNESAPPYDPDHSNMAQMLPSSSNSESSESINFGQELSSTEQLQELMNNHNERMRETLRLQFDVGRAVVEEELLAGIAGRSARNLDMLLRGQ
ncbi:hypothetical protein AB833_26080 [Chromatiales bacterium (ex Bugula neritina AB1)]|nr:hypothetical protein AB833_26080 [Chromatiales bacterium (ex Bugula neritina AB1)]